MESRDKTQVTVGLAQIAPVWLDRARTLQKVNAFIEQAATKGCDMVVFGEALVPGYPFWIELTDGARFNSDLQKAIYAEYVFQSVRIDAGDLDQIRATAGKNRIAVYLGTVECAPDRGGHSLYCSLVFLDQQGEIASVLGVRPNQPIVPTWKDHLYSCTYHYKGGSFTLSVKELVDILKKQ